MIARARASLVVVVGMLAALGIAGAAIHVGENEAQRTGLVIVTLDTTRADRLSPYGFMNVSLPALEGLARDSVVFDQAASVAPLTLPVHASLFTGLNPPRHGVRDNADPPLAEVHTTLAEMLATHGFRTAAFVGSDVLAPDRGLRQGFDVYGGLDTADRDESPARQRRADAVVDEAIGWIETVGAAPFFLWVHLYDAHRPYDPPEPYRTTYGHDPYLGEIAFADAQLGRLIGTLERLDQIDRTVLVVTADHGEALGDHGEQDHGIFIYEEVLRVPLLIRAADIPARRVGPLVRLIDLMPTALDLLGLPQPELDGESLVPLMEGGSRDPEFLAYAESLYPERFGWSPLRSLRAGPIKFIDAPRPELYDLDRDPFETHNLHAERAWLVRAMSVALANLAGDAARSPADASEQGPTPELRERLASLGYVGGPQRPTVSDTPRPDPKDCIGARGGPGAPRPSAACRPVPSLSSRR